MAFSLDVPALEGSLVRVEPLSSDHVVDLEAAADDDRSAFQFTWVPSGRVDVERYVETQLGRRVAGELAPFAVVRRRDSRAIGSTSLFNFRSLEGSSPYAAEIGFTWLGASAQQTGINLETKLLLLTFAFEQWGLARVDFKTDARNTRSYRALEGLGAHFEGILRNFGPSWAPGENGKLRDSAMFSIVDYEWPAIQVRLRERLRIEEPS